MAWPRTLASAPCGPVPAGANVRRYALARQMSLDQVAHASGITTERLLAIFRGDFDPELGLLGKIAEILGVALSKLLAEPEFN